MLQHFLNLVIPDELQLNLSSTDEQCYQAEDGTATATVTGGFGQYEYDWQNEGGTTVATTAVASNLAPGKYTVKVIDKKPVPEDGVSYCFVEGEVTIAPAEELKFKLDTFYAGCYNSNKG